MCIVAAHCRSQRTNPLRTRFAIIAITRRVSVEKFLPAWLVVLALCEPLQTGFAPGWVRCQLRMVHPRHAMRSRTEDPWIIRNPDEQCLYIGLRVMRRFAARGHRSRSEGRIYGHRICAFITRIPYNAAKSLKGHVDGIVKCTRVGVARGLLARIGRRGLAHSLSPHRRFGMASVTNIPQTGI